jgi:hypothetical protein
MHQFGPEIDFPEPASPFPGAPLFAEPIKTSVDDDLGRRIKDSLGSFDAVANQVTHSAYSTGLIGVDQMPPTPRMPEPIHDPDGDDGFGCGDDGRSGGSVQDTTPSREARFHPPVQRHRVSLSNLTCQKRQKSE